MATLVFKELEINDPLIQKVNTLRNIVLRKPLGMELTEAEKLFNLNDRVFIILNGTECVACCAITKLNNTNVKLRQMAVSNEYQAKGIGTMLVQHIETNLKAALNLRIELHAREYAIPFYSKLGYATIGNWFLEVGIPHYKMEKYI
jgi:predicted GNAT family N-acyltransferase